MIPVICTFHNSSTLLVANCYACLLYAFFCVGAKSLVRWQTNRHTNSILLSQLQFTGFRRLTVWRQVAYSCVLDLIASIQVYRLGIVDLQVSFHHIA